MAVPQAVRRPHCFRGSGSPQRENVALEAWKLYCIGVKAGTAASVLLSQVPESRAVTKTFRINGKPGDT